MKETNITTEKGEFVMKKFNNAEIVELNLNETANGLIPFLFETCILFDGPDFQHGSEETTTNEEQPGTPIDNETQLS